MGTDGGDDDAGDARICAAIRVAVDVDGCPAIVVPAPVADAAAAAEGVADAAMAMGPGRVSQRPVKPLSNINSSVTAHITTHILIIASRATCVSPRFCSTNVLTPRFLHLLNRRATVDYHPH